MAPKVVRRWRSRGSFSKSNPKKYPHSRGYTGGATGLNTTHKHSSDNLNPTAAQAPFPHPAGRYTWADQRYRNFSTTASPNEIPVWPANGFGFPPLKKNCFYPPQKRAAETFHKWNNFPTSTHQDAPTPSTRCKIKKEKAMPLYHRIK